MTTHETKSAWDTLTARELMQTEIVAISARAPLTDVEKLLGEHRIGGVPVTNEAGQVVGVLSMRDLVEHWADNPDSHPNQRADNDATSETDADYVAGDIMNDEVFTVDANATAREVAREMTQRHVHRLLVKDHDKHVGLVTAFDILQHVVDGV